MFVLHRQSVCFKSLIIYISSLNASVFQLKLRYITSIKRTAFKKKKKFENDAGIYKQEL